MKSSLRRTLGVIAATMAALAATALPASAASDRVSPLIHRVSCDRTDYLEVHGNNGQSVLCFADRGFMGVAIYGINWIESGNNRAEIQFQRSVGNPRIESVTMGKWSAWNPGHVHKVTRIEIF